MANLWPAPPYDWLLVAGNVAEKAADIEWALRTLRARFATVVWVPGNHELWTLSNDPVQLRGEARYQYLVSLCCKLGVITPEGPYPGWRGAGGPAVIARLFVLYDYTFRPDGTTTKAESVALAYETGIVCSDEAVLHADPCPSREDWCYARVKVTEQRLAGIRPGTPTVLVSHFPLTREPTRILKYPRVRPSRAAPNTPPTGTYGSARGQSSTGTCTYLAPAGRMACASRKCHWAIQKNST